MVAVWLLLAASAGIGSTAASYTATTSNPGSTLSADVVAPPTSLSATPTCSSAPSIALRATTSGTNGSLPSTGSTLVLSTPAGTAAGDVLIAHVANRDGHTLSTPSGWTLLDRKTSGTEVSSAVLWRVATAGEPASTTFTISGTAQMVGGIAAYTGASSTSPVHDHAHATGNTAAVALPTVATTVAGTRLVYGFTKRQEALTSPSQAAERWRLLSGSGVANAGSTLGDEAFAGPGPTPARTSGTTSFTSEWVGHTIALRRPPGTATAVLSWTPSTSSWAAGYRLERVVSGTVQATSTVAPISSSSTTDGTLTSGTTYTYRLTAYRDSWTSTAATTTLTPAC